MVRALVLGVNGQDGSYVAEELLCRGYRVLGLGRQPESRYLRVGGDFAYQQVDLRLTRGLGEVLRDFRPEQVFHFAAVHGPAGFSYESVWQEALAVNVATVHEILEFARLEAPSLRLVYAASPKVFGAILPPVITEETPQVPSCLYGLTKIAAGELIKYYRTRHGLAASILYLFNHESPRRQSGYFVPTVCWTVKMALADKNTRTPVNTLDFYGDWGCAREYMSLAVEIAEKAPGEDFIIASGKTWHGRDFAQTLFAGHGLDYRVHLAERNPLGKSQTSFRASNEKLAKWICRLPQVDILEVCDRIMGGAG